MQTLDVTEICKMTKSANPNVDFDGNYTFFYDETNNLRKLRLKNGDFNEKLQSNFVLGGICYFGAKPDIGDVFKDLKLQPSIKEVKFKHVAKGEFEDCLKFENLSYFLHYLLKSPLYIHYSSLNFIYYSIVDIFDSALNNTNVYDDYSFAFIRYIKNILYKVCKANIQLVTALFFDMEYPNIKQDDLNNFIMELLMIISQYSPSADEVYGIAVLETTLKESLDEHLVFIQNDTSHLLIDGLGQFYWRPVYTFANSSHHFDDECEIEKEMEHLEIKLNGETIKNYSFSDSKDDIFIQCSDIIVGLIGKLSKFINTHNINEITEKVENFNDRQLKNLDLYLDLYIKSLKENSGFIHSADSDEELYKHNHLFDLRDKVI